MAIPKQLRYIIASAIQAGMVFIAFGAPYPYNLLLIPFLCVASYILTWFALLEDIKKHEWFVLFVLPVVWTACFYTAYYVLPSRFASRFVFTLIHLSITYIVIGAMNIFNVGVEKNIQLQRAAQAANQFVVVIVFYLFTQILAMIDLHFVLNSLLVAIFALLVGIQIFWTDNPTETISRETVNLSLFLSFVTGHIMVLLSFVPFVLETPRPMIVTGVYYILSGILSQYHDEIALRSRLREYIALFTILVIATLITIQW